MRESYPKSLNSRVDEGHSLTSKLMAITLAVLWATAPLPSMASPTAPQCDSDAEGSYVDSLTGPADAASERGDHRLAMKLYLKAADYGAHCAPIDLARTVARSHTGDPKYNPADAFYSQPMTHYEDAAKEADAAGLRNERCEYMRRSLVQQKSIPELATEKPSPPERHLLRGC